MKMNRFKFVGISNLILTFSIVVLVGCKSIDVDQINSQLVSNPPAAGENNASNGMDGSCSPSSNNSAELKKSLNTKIIYKVTKGNSTSYSDLPSRSLIPITNGSGPCLTAADNAVGFDNAATTVKTIKIRSENVFSSSNTPIYNSITTASSENNKPHFSSSTNVAELKNTTKDKKQYKTMGGSASSGSSGSSGSSSLDSASKTELNDSPSKGANKSSERQTTDTKRVLKVAEGNVTSYSDVPINKPGPTTEDEKIIEVQAPAPESTGSGLDAIVPIITSNFASCNIGINSGDLLYYGGEMPLKNLAKMSMGWIRPWGSSLKDVALDLDNNGYLKTVDSEGAQTIISDDAWGRSADDKKYVLLYDGEGKLIFNLNKPKIIKEEPGRIELELADGRMGMMELSTNPANYLKNIRIIPLKDESNYRASITRDEYRNLWKGAGVIRFMNSQRTNNSKEVRWEQRQQAATFGAAKGQSLEDIVQMSNEMNSSPWLTVPHLANDDYFRNMAIYVRNNLDPDLKVYIEYTNEAWNWGFTQTSYLKKLAEDNGTTIYQEYGQRSKRLFEIWGEVFGGNDRLVRVIGTQHHNPWISEQIMKTQGLSNLVDALAVGYYVGHELGGAMAPDTLHMSEDEIFSYLNTQSLPKSKELLIKQKEVADKYDLELIAYEAGQHLVASAEHRENATLVNKLISLNRNPKMYQLYINMYKDWNDVGGGMIVWFQSAGQPTKWGSWGLLEDSSERQQQTAPKYKAFKQMLRNSGC